MNLLRGLVLLALATGLAWIGLQSWRVAQELPTSGAGGGGTRASDIQAQARRQAPFERRAVGGTAGTVEVAREGVDPEPYEWNSRAIELLDGGTIEEAVELLEHCVERSPEEPVFVHNLAEALTRLARDRRESEEWSVREEAIGYLRRATELAPERDELQRLLERWETSTAAEKDLWRKKTLHFELSFDGTRDELMWGTGPLESELESSYGEFGELFGFFPVESGRPRIRVVLLRREEFAQVTGIGDWAAGAFDGTVRVPVEDLRAEQEGLKRVLRHELVHAFVQEVGGNQVPGWLNEGLAQWLEAPFDGERPRDVQRALRRLKGADLFDLERLNGSLASWDSVEEIEVAYAESLAFVAYLRKMYGERVLIRMVAGCRAGETPAQSFAQEMGGLELDVVLQDFAQTLQ